MTEEDLLIAFSNYERTVWIINSVEGHLRRYYSKFLVCFDRFPAFPLSQNNTLTPDFAVSFAKDFYLIGEVKRALGLDLRTIEETHAQLCKYDRPLKFRRSPSGLHEEKAKSHDLVVFTNIEHARKEARRLRNLANEQSKPTRPLIIFSVAFDTQQAKSRWVLSCITDLSDRFSDSKLPEDARLSVRHQDHEEPIVIYIAEYAALQATQAFCNDKPPSVYTAVILWARVLPKLIPDDQRKAWALEANLQGTVEFLTSMDAIVAESHRQRLIAKRAHISEAMNLLEASKLVMSQDGKLRVRYRRFRSARGDYEDDEAAEAAMDHTKRGLVREIARSVKSKRTRKTITTLSRRSPNDPNQLPLL
jgi:hypothetical protein